MGEDGRPDHADEKQGADLGDPARAENKVVDYRVVGFLRRVAGSSEERLALGGCRGRVAIGWRWCFCGSHVGFTTQLLGDLKRPLISNPALQRSSMAV